MFQKLSRLCYFAPPLHIPIILGAYMRVDITTLEL
jgi:hypothetical protein